MIPSKIAKHNVLLLLNFVKILILLIKLLLIIVFINVTKTNCPWQANFYFGKHAADIHLTKFNNSHNHQCDPVSIELAPKNLRFSQSILDKIEHYTTKGVQVHDESDAATMFLYLLKQHEEDPNYIIIQHLEGPSNKLTSLFWDVVIHDNTAEINRYEMALSLFVGIDNNFKTRVLAQALTKYETQADYIVYYIQTVTQQC
ncbi:unnamed protein product [Rhizophagus irregularis]|nr:unnamed protein product [Rhizophagus irregularis]